MAKLPDGTQIRARLANLLAGGAGGTEEYWVTLIDIEVLSIWFNIEGNWRAHATGERHEVEAITEAARLLATVEPYAYE